MKIKNDRQFYVDRAKSDLKDLIIFFNVTRPQHLDSFKTDGKFDLKKLLSQLAFVEGWHKRTRDEKAALAKTYSAYSKNLNYAFGIPSKLINKVCGEWVDENGKHHRISSDEIVQSLVDEGFIRVINAGRKFDKSDDGEYKVKAWWCKKYIIANQKYWYKMISDSKYSELYNYASSRLRKIIGKWFEEFKHLDPIDANTVIKAYECRLIDFSTAVWIMHNIMMVDSDRIKAWANRNADTISKLNSESLIENRKYSKKFWSRLYFGNIKSGNFDSRISDTVYSKFN